jgi:hypothetical protein
MLRLRPQLDDFGAATPNRGKNRYDRVPVSVQTVRLNCKGRSTGALDDAPWEMWDRLSRNAVMIDSRRCSHRRRVDRVQRGRPAHERHLAGEPVRSLWPHRVLCWIGVGTGVTLTSNNAPRKRGDICLYPPGGFPPGSAHGRSAPWPSGD